MVRRQGLIDTGTQKCKDNEKELKKKISKKLSELWCNFHRSRSLFFERGNVVKGRYLAPVFTRPCFSSVSINMNTIARQMGFTASQCDAPLSVQSGIEVAPAMQVPPGHAGVGVRLSGTVGYKYWMGASLHSPLNA